MPKKVDNRQEEVDQILEFSDGSEYTDSEGEIEQVEVPQAQPIPQKTAPAKPKKQNDLRAETSRKNLERARQRKKELAEERALQKAQNVVQEHIVEEEDSEYEDEEDDFDDETKMEMMKRYIQSQQAVAPKARAKTSVKSMKQTLQKSIKLSAEEKKELKKQAKDDERLQRFETLWQRIENAKVDTKKATRKPRTKKTVIEISQPKPSNPPAVREEAKRIKQLLDLGIA